MSEWYKMSVQLGRVREPHMEYTGPIWADKKEDSTMQVNYNGFTGELVKLEDVKFLGGVVSFG